jgi:D-alanyl-D-alanine carboxypeptidase (penicillin-binding protein 5/6)
MPTRSARSATVLLSTLALACGAGVATAPLAAAKTPKTPKPPAVMSTVGGPLLGKPGTQVELGTGVPAPPKKLTARSWLVADAETGQILAAHNAHWRLAPASTLKMLFADTVLPKLPSTEEHKVVPADLAGMGAGSSLVGVKEGLSYTVHDLWLGVFLRSGNDAVHVLASMNGGVATTVQQMQAEAKDLQADDTHVVTPDGYDEKGQLSSAYDLTLFARQGLTNADFRSYCSTVTAQFPGVWKKAKKGHKKKRESFQIQNTDRLLSGDYGLTRYPGIAGVKNGYTTNAGNTYTGVAQRDGHTLLVTVMHPAVGHDLVYKEATKLLNWGFAADGKVSPVGSLVRPLSAQASASPSPGTNTASPAPSASASGAAHAAPPGSGSSASASASTGSSSRGRWTALALAGGSVVVLGALAWLVRRRWPLPRGES